MRGKFPLYTFLAVMLCGIAWSCNDDDVKFNDDDAAEYDIAITSFSLQTNKDVLENLDSVFFTIDLNNFTIFNADSLPKGTDIRKFVVNIGYGSMSKVEVVMPNYNNTTDTIVNYKKHSTDTINFSRGEVTVRVTSFNKAVTHDYTVKINVHQVESDLLYWNLPAKRSLPSNLTGLTDQKTVRLGDEALCFTTDGSAYCRAASTDPYADNWTMESVTLPSGTALKSLTATEDALYVVDGSQKLYKSTDKGSTWSDTGAQMSHIYGGFGTMVVGVRNDSGNYIHTTYPATTESAVAAECPIEGTSNPLIFSSEWSEEPMLIIAGGLTASGAAVGSTWAYDGTSWAKISVDQGFPAAEGVTLVPYYEFKVNENWIATKYPTLLAIGGRDEAGNCHREVYLSRDRGLHWHMGDELIQMPIYMPSFAGAQALVFDHTITSRSASQGSNWTSMSPLRLPAWYHIEIPGNSRAVAPITQWECPYIYLFGGQLAGGSLNDCIWRGAINRLTFRPLQ